MTLTARLCSIPLCRRVLISHILDEKSSIDRNITYVRITINPLTVNVRVILTEDPAGPQKGGVCGIHIAI